MGLLALNAPFQPLVGGPNATDAAQDEADEGARSTGRDAAAAAVLAPTNREVERALVAVLDCAGAARARRDALASKAKSEALADAEAALEAARWDARMALRRSTAKALRGAVVARNLVDEVGGPRGGLANLGKATLVSRIEKAEMLL